ncbi:cell wall hydrolase/autolysin [Nostoc sp. NIES-2111]|nr:cell wall hydrolase/autolysin [Nostoc sp. NIES-2111]
MKFGIDIGHNCPPDTGASGIKQEDGLTKAVGTLLIQKLKDAGHTVVNCTPTSAGDVDDSLRQRVDKANSNNVNIFVSIHFNAANKEANGSEIYAISNSAKGIAQSVLKEIVQLGFRDRGVKSKSFFVLKNTQMPAILIECCFCDSQIDMDRFNAEDMAEAIKVGLIGETKELSATTNQDYILEITVPTVLKASTQQASKLKPETLAEINPGKYPILDFSFEEQHYLVKWTDKSFANRDEHFVFAGHSKIEEKT